MIFHIRNSVKKENPAFPLCGHDRTPYDLAYSWATSEKRIKGFETKDLHCCEACRKARLGKVTK
jgi:hypothetical protein